jgi:hypothetical protein
MMGEDPTPTNTPTAILGAMEVMAALFFMDKSILLTRLVTVDTMHQMVMETAASTDKSIQRVATVPLDVITVMESTEADTTI